jgi:crotonobetainyl-CoA:carnitine CoA-transferase CaiB-like acyl-CoA transferase
MNKLPLSGVQVIDFGHRIAGPTVGMILADLGATVIKVNAPNSKEKDYDAITNRNKQCITIDLKDYDGVEKAKELIAKADVIIENFRPGVMERLGLDFKNIVENNKGIVALSLPGFCSNDEVLAPKKATEAVISAHAGIFSEMGPNRTLMGIEPSHSSLTMASLYGAVIGASAVVFALQSRENTGYGDYIEVPLCAALTECLLAFNIIKIYGKPKRYLDLRDQEVQRRKAEGIDFNLTYDQVFSSEFMDPFYRPYKCKDGRTYYVVSIAHSTHATRVMKTLGVYDNVLQKIKDHGYSIIEDVYLPKAQWQKQGSFDTYPVSREWSDFINEELEAAFLTKASWEWEKILADAGAVGGVHRTLHEWMNNKHVRSSGLFVDVEDHKLGVIPQPGVIAWADDYADNITYKSRIDTTYEDALNSLNELEKSKNHFKRNNIGWLDGVKVLDLSNVIAGPHSGAVLARYGAEVIKIDPSNPTFDPSYILYAFNTGQGKKSALVDIRTEEGYEILSKLIKEVDIVILNAVDKQVKKLKLDRESLQKINPNIIFSQLDLYSSLNEGSMTNTLGYDDIAQAVTGIMTRFGEGLEQPEEHAHLGTIDVMCGFASTLSVAVALYTKNKDNEIIQPRTSLTASAGILQIPFVIASKDKEPKSKSRNVKGEHAFSMIYVCSDEYSIYIDTDFEELSSLRGDFDILEEVDSSDYVDVLIIIIKRQSSSYWIDLLNEKDIAISRVNHMRDTRDYNLTAPDGTAKTNFSYSFTRYNNHPSGYVVEMVAPYAIQPKYASIYELSPAEKYGSSTFEILSNLGYSKEFINRLAEDNVISYQWAEEYLPS